MLHVVSAPWWGVIRPIEAARCLAAQPWLLIAITYLVTLSLVGFAIWGLFLWNATKSFSALVASPESIILAVVAIGLLGSCVIAWLYFPFIHCIDRPWHSYQRALGGALSTLGTALLLTAAFCAPTIALYSPNWTAVVRFDELVTVFYPPCFAVLVAGLAWRLSERVARARILPIVVAGAGLGSLTILGTAIILAPFSNQIDFVNILPPIYPLAICLFILRIDRTLRSLRPVRASETDLPPTCEGCGYDLTLQPDDGRCPECARPVRNSLDQSLARPGTPWEIRRGPGSWVRAYSNLLFTPSLFYASTRVRRGDDRAVTFARWMYLVLGCGGACWFSILAWLAPWGPTPASLALLAMISLMGAMATVLVCWFGHRIGGAVVMSYWLARRAIPDHRWSAKVIDYESAFLGVYCVFWGLAWLVRIIDIHWGANVLGRTILLGPIGPPIFFVIVSGGTVALSVGWFWRYQIALRAIRWNNF